MDFPELTIEDLARASRAVVNRLGIRVLHGLVGPSMGGLSALAYVAQYPTEVRRLLVISSAARPEAVRSPYTHNEKRS